jgi:hypothetical protein
MSSNPMWKRDANGVEHPTPETLLAFMREQCTEHEKSRINEHLLTGCVPCNRVRAGLTPSSNALNRLKHMSRYLYYPELQSNQVLLHAQRGEPLTSVWTGKRKRKFQVQRKPQVTGLYAPKAGMRYMSIPAAFAIFLIVAVIAIALAYALVTISGGSILNKQPGNYIYNSRSNSTGVAQHQPTPPNTVGTLTPSPAVSGSPTESKPMIKICAHSTYMFLKICGFGFKKGHKISLVLDYYGSKPPFVRNAVSADNLGKFMDDWNINSCHNVPIAIYAEDVSQKSGSETSNVLVSIQVMGCAGQTPTSTLGGRS